MKDLRPQKKDLRTLKTKREVRFFTEGERVMYRFMLSNLWKVMKTIEQWYATKNDVETFETWKQKKGIDGTFRRPT